MNVVGMTMTLQFVANFGFILPGNAPQKMAALPAGAAAWRALLIVAGLGLRRTGGNGVRRETQANQEAQADDSHSCAAEQQFAIRCVAGNCGKIQLRQAIAAHQQRQACDG